MKIPTTLKHKPVIVSDNYENVGGRYAYNTDAKGLSLGLAQWNDRGRVDVSAKVWSTQEKNGPDSLRNYHSTVYLTLQFWFAGQNFIIEGDGILIHRQKQEKGINRTCLLVCHGDRYVDT